VVKAHQLINLL